MLPFAVSFVVFGILMELIGGTYFQRFFDRSYPEARMPFDDVRIKVRFARILLILGLVLLLVEGISRL